MKTTIKTEIFETSIFLILDHMIESVTATVYIDLPCKIKENVLIVVSIHKFILLYVVYK
jgi:hypothetical protein